MNPKKLELIAALKQAATAADAVVKRIKVEGPDTVTNADCKVAIELHKAAIPGLILELIADIELLTVSRGFLLADLQEAATTLRRYETLHRAKGTEESTAKAEVNAELAARFESTIKAVQP